MRRDKRPSNLIELMKDPTALSTTYDVPRRPNYEGKSIEELEAMLDEYKKPAAN